MGFLVQAARRRRVWSLFAPTQRLRKGEPLCGSVIPAQGSRPAGIMAWEVRRASNLVACDHFRKDVSCLPADSGTSVGGVDIVLDRDVGLKREGAC